MEFRTTKIDWRTMLTRRICPRCIYYDDCYMERDCTALKILVDICEDMDSGNPDE